MKQVYIVAQRILISPDANSVIRKLTRNQTRPLLWASSCHQSKLSAQFRRVNTSSKENPTSITTLNDSSTSARTTQDHDTTLPSAEAGRRLAATKKFSHLMDHLQGNIFLASQRINDLTGYSGIEALKKRITILENRVDEAQSAVRTARQVYKTTVSDRAATQREVTTLLARKDSWTPSDLERFTALYRMDHSNEQAVQEATVQLADAEGKVEDSAAQLRSNILSRYHEEQIWSDKIRRMSTWGTWGLMGVNVLLFLVFQLGFEPWRRKRLVQGFEEKVREAIEQEHTRIHEPKAEQTQSNSLPTGQLIDSDSEIENRDNAADTVLESTLAGVPDKTIAGEPSKDYVGELKLKTYAPKTLSQCLIIFKDLFSDRVVEIKRYDITILALKSAALSATIISVFASLLFRWS
ncbi:BgTH12-04829 [Blumeria graminis f. sp. triticale]|uniref:Sensitive to high expression protein 9, mitochondrial n=3 Tax=Blumeria graminis TaxID=34373 RepID=A0A9X9L803_BLUGR|nr:hypothetical protein BGT96224_A20274 [Blumeria graminis f. sp. tritici 96224]CAD6499177.1 BgTH12-04829 [Blumeria graminis f. sp. triticale]VCU39292.1 BgtA-20274 [Blumeria graminis f. sp. tritici]